MPATGLVATQPAPGRRRRRPLLLGNHAERSSIRSDPTLSPAGDPLLASKSASDCRGGSLVRREEGFDCQLGDGYVQRRPEAGDRAEEGQLAAVGCPEAE